jgi:DNA-nicking Smr family endonuclease
MADDDIDFKTEFANITPLKQDGVSPWRGDRPKRLVKKPPNPSSDGAEVSSTVACKVVSKIIDGAFHRGGLQKSVLKKLRQGNFPIEQIMDLHGMRQEPASRYLHRFIAESVAHHCRVVLVIHGKGSRSEHNIAVLRPMVHHLLQQQIQVLAFCPAMPHDGGSGASYVYLRTPTPLQR